MEEMCSFPAQGWKVLEGGLHELRFQLPFLIEKQGTGKTGPTEENVARDKADDVQAEQGVVEPVLVFKQLQSGNFAAGEYHGNSQQQDGKHPHHYQIEQHLQPLL